MIPPAFRRVAVAAVASLVALLAGVRASDPARAGDDGPGGPPPPRAEAALIAETPAAVPGAKVTVGVRFTMGPGSHLYWRNPGDAGMAPVVRWTLPAGVRASEPAWPVPVRLESGGIVAFAYEGELLLPVEVDVPADYAGAVLPLRARVDWLVCTDICVDGGADLALDLPVRRGAVGPDPRWTGAFSGARAALPATPPDGALRARAVDGRIALEARGLPAEARGAFFFPEDEKTIEMAAPQEVGSSDNGGRVLSLRIAERRRGAVERLRGVLAWDTPAGRRGWTVDVAVAAEDAAPAPAAK